MTVQMIEVKLSEYKKEETRIKSIGVWKSFY